jgi:hypothetical protein
VGHVARMGEERRVYKVLVSHDHEKHLEGQHMLPTKSAEWTQGLTCPIKLVKTVTVQEI